ncbi:helix-turn-helix domain-containing protein [Brevibacterium litoralis]|uniref:helix-turn-helix domain-containing protein n=1 Tax=Brevibacterium litoralis TaxID=3138935 RepID=UPI0032EE34F2
MVRTLEDLQKLRPVDPVAFAKEKARQERYLRAWQLKELRRRRRKTQAQMAREMHVGQNRVSQIESARIDRARLSTLQRYAEALGGELHVEIAIGDERYPVS